MRPRKMRTVRAVKAADLLYNSYVTVLEGHIIEMHMVSNVC